MQKTKKEKAPDLDGQFRNNMWAYADFIIDDYKVSICHEFYSNQLMKMIYVNNIQRGAWMLDKESEENKRFAYSYFRFLYNKKERAYFKKILKGARFKEERKEYDRKIEARMFNTTVRIQTIIKQWRDREINKSICLVDEEGNIIFKYK